MRTPSTCKSLFESSLLSAILEVLFRLITSAILADASIQRSVVTAEPRWDAANDVKDLGIHRVAPRNDLVSRCLQSGYLETHNSLVPVHLAFHL